MKRTLILWGFMLSLSLTQAQTTQNLTGTWKVNWGQTLKVMKGENKTTYQSVQDTSKTTFERQFKGRQWVFGAEGSFRAIWTESQREQTGTWQLEGKELTIAMLDYTLKYKIEGIKNNQMILVEQTDVVGLFDKVCWQKQ
jgi:hypothetical protein